MTRPGNGSVNYLGTPEIIDEGYYFLETNAFQDFFIIPQQFGNHFNDFMAQVILERVGMNIILSVALFLRFLTSGMRIEQCTWQNIASFLCSSLSCSYGEFHSLHDRSSRKMQHQLYYRMVEEPAPPIDPQSAKKDKYKIIF